MHISLTRLHIIGEMTLHLEFLTGYPEHHTSVDGSQALIFSMPYFWDAW